jgi:hypothetical protein
MAFAVVVVVASLLSREMRPGLKKSSVVAVMARFSCGDPNTRAYETFLDKEPFGLPFVSLPRFHRNWISRHESKDECSPRGLDDVRRRIVGRPHTVGSGFRCCDQCRVLRERHDRQHTGKDVHDVLIAAILPYDAVRLSLDLRGKVLQKTHYGVGAVRASAAYTLTSV